MLKRLIPALLALLFAIPGHTDPYADSPTASLAELYAPVRRHDPEFAEAVAQWHSAREDYPQARANLLPLLNAQANYTRADTDNSGSLSAFTQGGYSTTQGYSISLAQSLYNHGAWAGMRAARARANSAEASLKAAEQNLILRLAERYYGVLAARDNLAFARAEQAAIERQRRDNQARYDVGLIAITDLHETQAAADLATARLIDAENTLMNQREQLFAMTGQAARLAPLAAPELKPPAPNDRQHWLDAALNSNADMLAAQSLYRAQREMVSAQRSAHYPNLELLASHSHSEQDGGSLGASNTDDNRYTVRLNVPLYAGGSVNAKVRAATAQRDASKTWLDWRVRQAAQRARLAFNNVNAAIARARALEKAVYSSQTSRESVQAGFDAGTRTSTDVLNAEREVLRARRDLSRAHYDYMLNHLRLKQASGQLSVKDLQTAGSQATE